MRRRNRTGMKIETKYDIGQTVWYCLRDMFQQGRIVTVQVEADGVRYQMDNTDGPIQEEYIGTTREECELHSLESEAEYLESCIAEDRECIEKMRRRIEEIKEKMKHDL